MPRCSSRPRPLSEATSMTMNPPTFARASRAWRAYSSCSARRRGGEGSKGTNAAPRLARGVVPGLWRRGFVGRVCASVQWPHIPQVRARQTRAENRAPRCPVIYSDRDTRAYLRGAVSGKDSRKMTRKNALGVRLRLGLGLRLGLRLRLGREFRPSAPAARDAGDSRRGSAFCRCSMRLSA